MKPIMTGIAIALTALVLAGKTAPHVPVAVASDWTQRNILFPNTSNAAQMARIQKDPRWVRNWYNRHPEAWWQGQRVPASVRAFLSHRDWSVPLGVAAFEPVFDFTFTIGPQTGYGSLNATDQGNGQFLASAGSLTVTGSNDVGTYPLYPGGPGVATSPAGAFNYDNLLFPFFPSTDPPLDVDGLLFRSSSGFEINIWGNSAGNFSFYDYSAGSYGQQVVSNGTLTFNTAPGGGQSSPAKFVFDVTATPSCTSDFVVTGIPATPAPGGQANIIGVNNLYANPSGTGYCPGTTPAVKFAYASGTGQVPAAVALSWDGKQIAYVENLFSGSSYFHVLTLGTTGTNGTSATAAVVPGAAGGNNAVDNSVLLSPDGGVTNQSSTNSVFVNYGAGVAYATTYSTAGTGSGYLYKISNVLTGSGTPTIVWSTPINAVPSTPVYDWASNRIFFTDSNGRIDYVADAGASPSAVYSSVLASGATSENPVIIDSTNQKIYACFNSNGANAIVVQTPTDMTSSVSAPVGTQNTTYTGPYGVNFNNAWYTGSGTPRMYVAGTGSGKVPTLYIVGFDGTGWLNPSDTSTRALATDVADSSPVTEFYNPILSKDYLFVGVSNHCVATNLGGFAGCVMSLDITGGTPTVNASSTAIPATGGPSGIVIDNYSGLAEASSIYYATKTGATLVKATQSGLN